MKALVKGALAGIALGLALFALEGVLVMQTGAVGINLDDTNGPFAALFNAVRPQLPGLLARIALVYVLGGLALGLASTVLAGMLLADGAGKAKWVGAWLLEWAVLAAGLAGVRAVQRPALFDDVGWFRPILTGLVAHAAPWWCWAALGAWGAAHAVSWARQPAGSGTRVRWGRLVPVAVVVIAAGYGITFLGGRGPLKPLTVLIGVDALRPDRLGRGVVPHLDAFAKDATTFDRAFTPLAQTEPAYRSLLTARWPPATGVRYPLTAQSRWAALPTFPEVLEKAGVRTHWATDCSRFNFQDARSGFGQRLQPPRGAINFALEKFRFRAVGVVGDNALGAWLVPELIDNRAIAGIYDPRGYAKRLAAKLVDAAGEGPAFFAWHATAAHFPGDPTYPFYRRFVRADAPLERRLRMVFRPIAGGTEGAADGWGSADSEALYDELLAQADDQVGVLLQALKDAGRYDEAAIIVFSDHGESFHPDFPALGGATPVHGARLREEENRIVLMVKPPHVRTAERVAGLVRLTDVGPTVLELMKVPVPEGLDGRSLGPLLRNEAEAPRLLYAETGYTHASPTAFDPGHSSGAPRTFDAYTVRPDGVIEMSPAAHDGVMQEKDVGAFDGEHWLVRSPRADGTVAERCDGNCDALKAFLSSVDSK